MTQTTPKLVSFEEFTAWRPEGGRYELQDGVIVEMVQPTGKHEDIIGFLVFILTLEHHKLNLPYRIPKTALVKPPEKNSGYCPDVLLLNRDNLQNEPLWDIESTVSLCASIPLVIEVVSTNWRDDYFKKRADYEEMGIPEYWIVDHAALGGRNFIGSPKQSTVTVCKLVDGEYQATQFRGNSQIVSSTFPQLKLTAQQIFDAAL
ncbi:MAG: Uma2 family endonuclease [Cyanomargarita calcarea GSE-NOS-MK-12-04C]|jgi:Uma2 family endonuclease|uniref:Uma2 family endonuclease n=1 Tax=Cyanomargarita calcarea GSE-NOS-MK-12-04C TaxID=2839659 RepID=A0A951QSP8_9CYAN|nr:Uma2 family endonuclease [Cyanomargarita calcarea GSE-NOS-MK-12-04C]